MLLTVAIFGWLTFGCKPKATPLAETSPFQSMVVLDDSIIVTLPKQASWIVDVENTDISRKAKPGESFTLKDGASLTLVERHSGYRVTAKLTPEQGIMIERSSDTRSFGGELKKKKYFIPAQNPEPRTTPNQQ